MWRFFLAGLVTVCGLVLLFMASMGDPLLELHHAQTWLQMTAAPDDTAAPQARTNAAAPQQDDTLRQQVQSLQSKLAETTQDVTALRSEADAEKRVVDALHQQHDADQAQLAHLRPAAAPSPPGNTQPAAPVTDTQTQPTKSANTLPPVSVPQTKPPAPQIKSAENQPKQIMPVIGAAEAGPNRLRREPDGAPAEQTVASAPPPKSPQARLSDARDALTTGRIDDARHLLEQAQVQLAFRPVTPDGNIASTGSVAAGDVAEALSMLNAGDMRDALQYIDLALHQSSGAAQTVTDAERSPYREGWPRP